MSKKKPRNSNAVKDGMQDSGALRLALDELQEQIASYRGIMASSSEGILIHDEGVVLEVNDTFAQLMGSAEAVVGQSLVDLVAEESKAEVLARLGTRQETPFEVAALSRDGTRRHVEVLGKDHVHKGRKVRLVVVRDITERKQAEAALLESEERFRDLFEEAPVLYMTVGTDGMVQLANRFAAEIMGCEPDDMVGRPVLDFCADVPEGKGKAQELFQQFIAGHEFRNEEILMQREDGGQPWICLSVRPLLDADGEVVAGLSMAIDITDRKQAEEALREHASWLALAGAAGGVGTFDWDIQKDELKCSNECFQLYGVDPGPAVSLESLTQYIHEDDVERMRNEVTETLEHDAPYATEYRVRWPDGSIHWIGDRAEVVRDEEGRAVRFHGAIVDITERKQAEAALRESEQMFRLVSEHLAEVVWLVDPLDYHFIYISPSYEELWDRTCQSLFDDPLSWLDAIHPEDIERVQAALEEQTETGLFDEDFRIIRSDGSVRWVSDRGFGVTDESGQLRYMVGLANDITEQREAEETLQQAREELESKAEAAVLRGNAYGLTFRELSVLHLVASGRADKEIATELGIRPHTASRHVKNILHKMDATSRTDAGVRAVREQLID
jgi:PAS domain S-box-containing protein